MKNNDELLARDWKTADGVKIVDGLRNLRPL